MICAMHFARTVVAQIILCACALPRKYSGQYPRSTKPVDITVRVPFSPLFARAAISSRPLTAFVTGVCCFQSLIRGIEQSFTSPYVLHFSFAHATVMSYASPIDISSFTELEEQHNELSECVFALDIGGSLAKLAYQTTFRYKKPARNVLHTARLANATPTNIGQLACLYARLNNVQRILFGSSTSWSESKVAGAPSFSAPGSGRRSVHTGPSRSSSGGQTRNPSGMLSNNTTYDAATNTAESEAVADVQDDDSNTERLANRGPRFSLESTPRTLDFSTEWSAFELEHLVGVSLSAFPLLLSPADYVPDTWDLTQDTKARAYWLECFKQGVERIRKKAEESQADTKSDANARSQQFADLYVAFLNELADYPSGRGILTVRCILEAQQHFLRKLGFPDAFCHQKKLENSWALSFFPGMMERLKSLDWSERQVALARGILAGNIFDWGASEAVRFFMQSQTSVEGMASFDQTENKIPPRPWLMDDFDRWIQRIALPEKRPHCVLIFCDNSGADLILGVLPFAIECLEWGSKVILTANSDPAINDVTYPELLFLMNQVADLDQRLAAALDSRRLVCVDSGQNSPCLDLRRVSQNLVKLVNEEKVDLIVLEGMGRAVHTNLYARFCVDCLKIAVIKNSWLAGHLGGNLFSVIFKYEQYSSDSAPKPRPSDSS
nr:unnamed protein product [Spirometra erinaceieuropaei]